MLELDAPRCVFYDLDTPITLQRLSSGTSEYLRYGQISAFDLYLSFTGGNVLKRLQQPYGVRLARPLYGCDDPDLYCRVEPRPKFA